MGFEQKPVRMSIVDMSRPRNEGLTAQFNPTELQEAIQVQWSKLRIPGQSHELLQFSHTGNLRYSFTLRFSAFAQDTRAATQRGSRNLGLPPPPAPDQVTQKTLEDMQRARRFLLSLAYPQRGGNNIPSSGPPRLLFVWPQLVSLTCVLNALTFTYQRFNHQLAPVEFTVQITIEEIRDVKIFSEQVFDIGTNRSPE